MIDLANERRIVVYLDAISELVRCSAVMGAIHVNIFKS
jgi:hypothetical protein